jgi:hypothetical protein
MGYKLPDSDAVFAALLPHCPDDQTQTFARWFAERSGGKELRNVVAVEWEIASALDDYAKEGNTTPLITSIWYSAYGSAWVAALTG